MSLCPHCEKAITYEHDMQQENLKLYHLLAMAHLTMRHHLEYGFDPHTTRSTLISVGQLAPKLQEAMDKLKGEIYEVNIRTPTPQGQA